MALLAATTLLSDKKEYDKHIIITVNLIVQLEGGSTFVGSRTIDNSVFASVGNRKKNRMVCECNWRVSTPLNVMLTIGAENVWWRWDTMLHVLW